MFEYTLNVYDFSYIYPSFAFVIFHFKYAPSTIFYSKLDGNAHFEFAQADIPVDLDFTNC